MLVLAVIVDEVWLLEKTRGLLALKEEEEKCPCPCIILVQANGKRWSVHDSFHQVAAYQIFSILHRTNSCQVNVCPNRSDM